jgi:hypothetical protein
MMIHPCIGISFNGLYFHNLYKYWTHPKKKIEFETFQIVVKMQFQKNTKD